MSRRATLALLVLAASLPAAGCRLHVGRVALNRPLPRERFAEVVLGKHARGDVLELLGPPDRAHYTPAWLVFDYFASDHRGSDLRFFVPSFVVPAPVNPLFLLSVQEFFFDLFTEPEEYLPNFMERTARAGTDAAVGLVPFTSGEDVVTLHGRQLRFDRLRIVFDRHQLKVQLKALRLATGEYEQESLADQVLLQAD